MPTITKSIGSSGRDYSTIALWEADLDNGAIYAAGDTAQGEIYKDSIFSERPVVNGGGTVGLAAIKLTVPTSQRHTGIAGSGAILKPSGNGIGFSSEGSIAFTLEGLELNGDSGSRSISQAVRHSNFTSNTNPVIFQHLLVHNSGTAFGEAIGIDLGSNNQGIVHALNNIVYDITSTQSSSTTDAVGIRGTTTTRAKYILNNTVHDIVKNNGSSTADAYGIQIVDDADYTVKNNIATDAGGTTTGTKACFTPASVSLATVGWNLSSDTTASGTGSLVSKAAASQFVSTAVGAEDLHLKAGADAINAGTDLGTSPTGVNYDIDGRDRDALGDVWDIGADEYVSTGNRRRRVIIGAAC